MELGLRPLAASPGRQGRERFALLTIPLSGGYVEHTHPRGMLGAYLSPVGWGIGRHRVPRQGLLQRRVRQFYSCRRSWPHLRTVFSLHIGDVEGTELN